MFKYLNSQKLESGFTLVETLVSVMIFSLIVVTVGTIYVSAVSWERRVIATERMQENAVLIIESMAREIRVSLMSGPDSSGCTARLPRAAPVSGRHRTFPGQKQLGFGRSESRSLRSAHPRPEAPV